MSGKNAYSQKTFVSIYAKIYDKYVTTVFDSFVSFLIKYFSFLCDLSMVNFIIF
jgi:hypothetical protein